jgi:cysteine desulfurase
MSVSAHKLAGPKGVGALLVRKGLSVQPLLAGRQERNRRGGTENLPGIAGFAAACELAAGRLIDDIARMTSLRCRLEQGLLRTLPALHLYGRDAERLPNTACVRFGALESEQVLGRLERAGIVASSGAACTASGTQASHVLLAMGESALHAKASVRFSLGRETTTSDIERVIDAAQRAIGPLLGEPEQTVALAA